MKKLLLIPVLSLLLFSCNKVKDWKCTGTVTTEGVTSVPSLNGVTELTIYYTGTKEEMENYVEQNTFTGSIDTGTATSEISCK